MEALKNFEKLRKVLSSFDNGLEIKKDAPDYYYLNTNKKVKDKTMFFGAVQIRKSYVAYHLYPVYTHPELLDGISEDLKKRMQGKSCFNFKKDITEDQLNGINALTKASYEKYLENGYIEEK
ncbi:MAG: hypothetical protein KTR13_06625 [Saprospiraceae bacterium]|nr:hypothetical protein [Saprospiraceae bacterium]